MARQWNVDGTSMERRWNVDGTSIGDQFDERRSHENQSNMSRVGVSVLVLDPFQLESSLLPQSLACLESVPATVAAPVKCVPLKSLAKTSYRGPIGGKN